MEVTNGEDTMKKGVFLKAAVLAIVLFAISLYVGYSIESDSYSKTEAKLGELQEGVENSLLFSMFVQTHNDTEAVCAVLKSQLDETAQQTYNLYGELEESKSTSIFKGYESLRKKYFLANMRFYLMLREYKQACGDASLQPILFFYTAYNACPSCVAQGKVLDTVRYECKNARVYAFPLDAEELSIMKSFKAYYGISSAPSLVVGDKKYETLLGKGEIKELIGCAS